MLINEIMHTDFTNTPDELFDKTRFTTLIYLKLFYGARNEEIKKKL